MERWIEERMEELLPLMEELTKKYTSGESTSVTYEKAQELMEAVLYCIREYEQEQNTGFGLVPAEGLSVKEIYEKGYELVIRKVKKMRLFYNRLSKRFCSYGCRNYKEVMEKGMPEFFRRYDPRFAPQKTILTLDYPTFSPLEGLSGIDAIEQYLSDISLEQRFLGAFEEDYVCSILQAYDWNYREQFFNLCEIFLGHVFVCILIGRPFSRPVEKEDQDRLKKWREARSKVEIQEELDRILKRLVEERFGGNDLLYEYLQRAILSIVHYRMQDLL